MNIRLQHFCFRGGDKSEYDLFDFTGKNDSAWQEIAGLMANSAFPTEPEDDRSIPHMAFANLPGEQFGEDVRIHCVYFLIERARDFPNAFCFAYRQSECSLELLAGVTAEDWYDRCVKLTESHTEIELPQRTPPSDTPQLFHYNPHPDYYYLYGFPDSKGKLYSGRFTSEQWKDITEGKSPQPPPDEDPLESPEDTDPISSPPPSPSSKLEQFISLMWQFVCSELPPLRDTLRIVAVVTAVGISFTCGYFVGSSKRYVKGYSADRAEGVSAREKSKMQETDERLPNTLPLLEDDTRPVPSPPQQPLPAPPQQTPPSVDDTLGAAPSQSEPPPSTPRPMKEVQRNNRAEKGEPTDSSSEVSAHAAHPNKASGNTKSTKPRKAVPQQQR